MAEKKLEVRDLTVSFKTNQGLVRAVRGVSFDLFKGETLAIVGESGSGKSVSIRTIMGILAGNGMIDKGSIIYEGEDLTQVDEEHFHEIRGNRIGMIFQDPMSSLNPIMKIGKQITEGMILNGKHLDNRYKHLFQESRGAYISLKRNIKRAKRTKKSLKSLFNFEVSQLEFKYERKYQEEASTEAEIANLKAELETLKAELKVKLQADIDKQVPEAKARIQQLKAKLPEAKRRLKEEKAKAKTIVQEEWANAQAEAQADIKKIQAEAAQVLEAAKGTPEFNDLKREWSKKVADRKELLARVKKVTKKEAFERAIQVMKEVGIDNPDKRFRQYPFQFSGGMRQRIVIAIALTASPELLICDEPTTALDVTIQAQILELINDLKVKRDLSVIFITHDLGVVANMADRIAVMYAGKIVEVGTAEDVFYDPRHPYTWALLSSMPDLDSKERLASIPGTPPNMLFPPKGDAFAERNKFAMRIDFEEQPPMFKVSETHSAATWLLHEDAPEVDMPAAIKNRIDRMLQASSEVTANE